MTPSQFINTYKDSARLVERMTGVPASLILAQSALESGWNKSSLSKAPYFNFFGMKVGSGAGQWTGKAVNMKTGEVIDGEAIHIRDDFRTYKSPFQSFSDLALRHKRFNLNFNGRSFADSVQAVVNSGYATAPDYGFALMQIRKQYNLAQYDVKQRPDGILQQLPAQTIPTGSEATPTVSAQVVPASFYQKNKNWILPIGIGSAILIGYGIYQFK